MMRRFAAVLLVLAGVLTVQAETLSRDAFTAQFARGLQAALPSANVAVAGELQLTIRRADGSSATINLDNAHRAYSADPAEFEQLVRNFAAALAQGCSATACPIDRTRIVPVIKDRSWLEQLRATFQGQGASRDALYEDFTNELAIVYAEDGESRTRYLAVSENPGLSPRELRSLAIENLMRLMPKIEMREGQGFSMITSHPDYGASLLLVDELWTSGQIKVEGDIVVAVPAKDVILVTGSRNRKGLKAMRTAAHQLTKGQYGLIDTLFVYRKGRFVKFGRN